MAVFVLLLLLAAGYALRVVLFPFKTCRACRGFGRIAHRSGRGRPKPCRRCRGLGVRPRAFGKASRALREIKRNAAGDHEIRIRL
jgi:hypothetical protein